MLYELAAMAESLHKGTGQQQECCISSSPEKHHVGRESVNPGLF